MALERRSYPRVADDNIALRLKVDQFDTITHTLNISASGIYCKVGTELPLMSRVQLMLMFPGDGQGKEERRPLELTGVVVREHPVIIDGEIKHYDVAIFFDGLTEKNKEAISQYVTPRIR